MDFGFRERQACYSSNAQNARAWSEDWVAAWAYCPACGHDRLNQFAANSPVADFYCAVCREEFELKSQKKAFGRKVVDGAYQTMTERLAAKNNPSLLLLNYDPTLLSVTNLVIVPKHFFVEGLIEKRKPLAHTARRAGWTGCNIRLEGVPAVGKTHVVRNGVAEPKERVLERWQQSRFLLGESDTARGWLIETLRCVEAIGKEEFSLSEIYGFEAKISLLYPNNRHVRQKLRQQLQLLRDHGFIEFVSPGHYRLTRGSRRDRHDLAQKSL